MSNEELKKQEEAAIIAIKVLIRALPPDRRLETFPCEICDKCGYDHPFGATCQCWNDE